MSKAKGKPASIEEVQGLIQSIKDTKEALNGDQRLAKAKFKAEIFINQLKDLNNAQRVDSIKQANDTDNLKDLSQIVSTASDLNNSMSELKAKLKETVNPVKSSINYINADYDLKRQFNKAVKDAREALSKTKGANLNERDIQGLSQAIDSTKDALNGEQRLAEAKEKSKQFIKQLDTLNNAQNNYLTNEINKSDNIKDITNIVDNASSLNDAMKDLRDTVAQLNQFTKDSINYQNADEDLKLQFDNAINIANNVLNKKDGDNLDITVIEGMTQAIKDAKDALNGEQRLKNAQQAAHKAIDDALKHQLDEINHANATDESKAQAIKSVENAAKHANADIDHASSNIGVFNAENEGTTAIKHTHADELPKAKIDANNEIDQKLKGLLNNIDQNPNLSNQEKEKLKDDLNHAIENIKNEIDRATNKQAVADEKLKQII
ncbi:DNA repair exonuclease SbcCD ATPase subunit [Staphylococcus capitis]